MFNSLTNSENWNKSCSVSFIQFTEKIAHRQIDRLCFIICSDNHSANHLAVITKT